MNYLTLDVPPMLEKFYKKFDNVFTQQSQRDNFRLYGTGLLLEIKRKNIQYKSLLGGWSFRDKIDKFYERGKDDLGFDQCDAIAKAQNRVRDEKPIRRHWYMVFLNAMLHVRGLSKPHVASRLSGKVIA